VAVFAYMGVGKAGALCLGGQPSCTGRRTEPVGRLWVYKGVGDLFGRCPHQTKTIWRHAGRRESIMMWKLGRNLAVGRTLLLGATLAVLGSGCARYNATYDEYLDVNAQARVAKSKNVWVSSVDYNNDLIVVELKAKGYTIDASKADYSIDLDTEVHWGGFPTLTFSIKDAKTSKIIFSRVAFGPVGRPMTNDDVQHFIRSNLAEFQGQTGG
jgi:hypothetical protein